MKRDDSLFINHRIHKEMNGKKLLKPLSKNALIEKTTNANTILFISAYYDIDFLKGVFSATRHLSAKKITTVFARAAPPALQQQLEELNKFKNWLRGKCHPGTKIHVKLAKEGRFLHTKLYQFQGARSMQTLIGSANATSNGFEHNDEILIEIHGRNSGIDEYVRRTLDCASNCDDVTSKRQIYTSFQSLLRDGLIYFKSTRTLPYTLNCFEVGTTIYNALAEAVKGKSVPFHEPQSVGMLNILKLLGVVSDEKSKQKTAKHVNLVQFSVETSFGYWVPTAFQDKLVANLDIASERKANQFLAYGRKLETINDTSALKLVREKYFTGTNALLKSVSHPPLTTKKKGELEKQIIKRVDSLRGRLNDPDECKRLARLLKGTPVPEIWEDPRSKDEMIESFCEYVSWKIEQRRKSLVVKTITKWFDLETDDEPDGVRHRIEKFFKTGKTKSSADWPNDDSHADG